MKTSSLPKLYSWQTALMNAVTCPQKLLSLLELDDTLLAEAHASARQFALKVPLGFLSRIEKGNPNDPLLRQILPLQAELSETEGYTKDPLHETKTNPISGLLHKYHGRVLLTWTGSCAINCRYCFRRHFPYTENNPGTLGWKVVLDYIAKNTTITEVILSGGDPLLSTDATLKQFTEKLCAIPHVQRLRIHSRIPIVLPERITSEFVQWITSHRLKTVLVVHCNHPNEINSEVKQSLRPLLTAGITLLNQSVLLKNINDTAEILISLSETLFDAGVLPYYLHVLDKTQGTAHFDLALTTAKALHQKMAAHLPGYLVPKLVCDQPGTPAKQLLNTDELYTD